MAEGGTYNTTFPEDPNRNKDTVSLTTKWGGLSLGGKDALSIFLFITVLGLTGLTLWEHVQRSAEHDTLDCRLKLTLYMMQQESGKAINWRAMPTDIFGCIPKFLYERDQPRQ